MMQTSLKRTKSLLSWNKEVKFVNSILLKYAKTLPIPLNNTLIEYYGYRKNKSHNKTMFGEIAPFFLGSLLGISENVISKTILSWNLLYMHCLIFDDILDESLENRNFHNILSNILFDDFLIELKRITQTNDYQQLVELTLKYKKQAFQGMLYEETKSILVKENPIIHQGKKAFVVKACVQVMMHLEYNRFLTIEEEAAIEDLCCAVQLLDDIKDLKDDLINCKPNYLIIQIENYLKMKNLDEKQIKKLTPEDLLLVSALSNGLENSWKKINDLLSNVLLVLSNEESKGASFLNFFGEKSKEYGSYISSIKNLNPQLFLAIENKLLKQKLQDNFDSKFEDELEKLKDKLQSGPMASQ